MLIDDLKSVTWKQPPKLISLFSGCGGLDLPFHYAGIEDLGFHLMVTGATVRYRQGAHYGDHLRVVAWVDRLASRLLSFSYQVNRGDELLATGSTKHVWVDATTGRLCRTPEVLRQTFSELAGQ